MVRKFLVVASVLALTSAGANVALAQTPSTHQHSFSGAEHWAHYFDDPKRDEWQKPHEVIQALQLSPDATVADIGSGTGYFSVRLAHMLPQGRVFGVDIEPDMVKYLAERAKKEGLANVSSVAGAPDDPHLPAKVDLILMVDVYHHIENRDAYLRNLKSYLKPGGRVAIIDFNQQSPMGPPRAERITDAQLKQEMQKAGYTVVTDDKFLPDQNFVIFKTVG
jgi:cyclopropane fatty-acyl-phospholipid synthase-like methyltransferase